MALETYRRKRNFCTTPEPRGRLGRRRAAGLKFVIQKHAARALHYDFRLELNGVLLSWAVPKGPSLDPRERRLALNVEDHPLEYGSFEGIIPPKQYGSGTVMLWDSGTWLPKEEPAAGYRKGRLKFELRGEKLRGGWTLVRTRGDRYRGDRSWLLIKEDDEYARPAAAGAVVEDEPDSVTTGRSLEEIAEGADRVWHSNRSVAQNVRAGAIAPAGSRRKRRPAAGSARRKRRPPSAARRASAFSRREGARYRAALSAIERAVEGALPAFVEPELATLVKEAPRGPEWLHEMKLDGYRVLARMDGGKVRLYTRNRNDWTDRFPSIAEAVAALPVRSAWLDGEIVVMQASGLSSFQALQNALSREDTGSLHYYAFDLPFLDGRDLRKAPLVERKSLLEKVLSGAPAVLRYSSHVPGSGTEFYGRACTLGLEGIVSKRADSPYRAGRGRDWLKIKCGLRQEMVIGGYTDPGGARSGLGALLLGVYESDGRLRYSGKVGTGFDHATLDSLRRKLDPLARATPPFSNPPRGAEARRAHWVSPRLVAEIAFTEWTEEGTLRHPSFQGLRADKNPKEVVREQPAGEAMSHEPQAASRKPRAARGKRGAASRKEPVRGLGSRIMRDGSRVTSHGSRETRVRGHASRATGHELRATARDSSTVAGIRLTHPDKVLYPEARITKRDLALYYEAVGDRILPHLTGRPLTLVRCPNGWNRQCFYQKHATAGVPKAIERIAAPESGGKATYMMANSLPALIALAQMGVLELHPWGSSAPKLGHPDRIIVDIDPDDGLPWSKVADAARLVHSLLEEIGLTGFLKTTGGKGLHLVVPVRPVQPWDTVKGFTRAVAELLAGTFPDRFTATMSKAARRGKIYVDYLRNAEGATAIATWSARARANAPVSTPIGWDELDQDVRFDHFNAGNVPARLARLKKNPWQEFFGVRQTLTAAMMKRVAFEPDS